MEYRRGRITEGYRRWGRPARLACFRAGSHSRTYDDDNLRAASAFRRDNDKDNGGGNSKYKSKCGGSSHSTFAQGQNGKREATVTAIEDGLPLDWYSELRNPQEPK